MAQRAERRSETRGWTRADLQRLPNDGNRYEVLDGALLVTPQASFAHQEVATRILLALRAYCATHAIGDETLRWQPDGAFPALELRLDELFR